MATDVFIRAAQCLYSNSGFPGGRKQTFRRRALVLGQIGVAPIFRRIAFAASGGCDTMRDCAAGEICRGERVRRMKRMGHLTHGIWALGFALLLFAGGAEAQEQPRLDLMPWPANVQMGNGSLRI